MPETFCLTSLPTSEAALEAASQALYQKLVSEVANSPVLLLLAGGSAVKLYTRLAELLQTTKPDLKNLSIALEDDRWPEKNNTSDILKTPFIKVTSQLGATFIEVPETESLEIVTQKYAQLLQPLFNDSQTSILAVVGMGGDGHILSVNADQDAHRFNSLFATNQEFVGFESQATTAQFPQFPRRITLTLTGLKRVNYVISLVCGTEKLPMLQELSQPTGKPVNEVPALALLTKNGELFTDQSI